MSASLVGSEMCIRDSPYNWPFRRQTRDQNEKRAESARRELRRTSLSKLEPWRMDRNSDTSAESFGHT
eukprot:3061814-Alexandrium_andersonii.AAC.1